MVLFRASGRGPQRLGEVVGGVDVLRLRPQELLPASQGTIRSDDFSGLLAVDGLLDESLRLGGLGRRWAVRGERMGYRGMVEALLLVGEPQEVLRVLQ